MRLEVLIRDVLIKKVCKQQKDQMARAAGCQDSILQTQSSTKISFSENGTFKVLYVSVQTYSTGSLSFRGQQQ